MSSKAMNKNKILKMHSDYILRLQNLIDSCPEELLLKIFDFLDEKSIMRLTLVNKRYDYVKLFNQIISINNLSSFQMV